jgi:putative ABC transport system permease protein
VRGLRLHLPTITGRLRSEPGLLVLIGLVVALTTALTAAVAPLTERTADRAIAATVRDAGDRGAVVATLPEDYVDPRRPMKRHANALVEFRQDTDYALFTMPKRLAAVVSPGVASLTTPALHLLDAGPGRYLQLAFVDTPRRGAPEVTYTSGGPPQASVGPDQAGIKVPSDAEPWPVQVALSEAAAAALGLGPGDRLPAEDEQARPVDIRVSGVFVATTPDDVAWQSAPQLLHPVQGVTEGIERTSAAALVSADALPDLRLGVPSDDLRHRVVFNPLPSRLRWRTSADLGQDVVALKSSPGLARGKIAWDSLLDGVLADGRDQVATARGQAQVLLVGLLGGALLVLVLAAQLLLRRRAGPVAVARERGASLLGIGAELFVESLLVSVAGAAAGLLAAWLLVGDVGWGWTVPVLVVASLAGPVLGVLLAAGSTDVRRVPANRTARRTAARVHQVRRYLLEGSVLAVAVLTFVALDQRGVTGGADGGGDLTAASAPIWWAVAGTLVLVRAFPPLVRLVLRRARRSTGSGGFFVAAQVAQGGARLLPLLVVTTTVAQLTFGVAVTATEQRGQEEGALLAVGGDARLTTAPASSVAEAASKAADAPGVRAAAAGRVVDGVRASAKDAAASVRLVVVDSAAYERLLAASPLPDAPALGRLRDPDGDRVPALLLGGDPGLRDGLVVRWDEETTVPLTVVGTAPRVDAAVDPVVVVDAGRFTGAGVIADPNTVWAVGPGAAAALGESDSSGSLELYADVLDTRRDAPLAQGLVRLALASSALLLLFALLGVVLAAASDAPSRRASLGRLRSLGVGDRQLRRVLAGELLSPVVASAVVGIGLGVAATLTMVDGLSLELVTGQTSPPALAVPWWTPLSAVLLVAAVLAITWVEARRLRRTALAQLLRAGDPR